MSWFSNRNKPQIPEVPNNAHDYDPRRGPAPGGAPADPGQGARVQNYYRPSNATYNASRDRDLYSAPVAAPASSEPYARRQIGLDPYKLQGRHPGGVDQDRAELFSGYDPKAQATKTTNRGYGRDITSGDDDITAGDDQEQAQALDSDEEVEAIKKDIRWTKQETVGSSRNALRLAREAEETARNTLLKLGDQSEKLADTERHLDIAKAHTNRAEDATNELKQLNRSIFRPVITFNKRGKREAEQARIEARHEEEREDREKAMSDVRDTQNRIGRAATYGQAADNEELLQKKVNRVRGEGRKKYQFEATESDDELEDELDDNLDEIGDVAKRLRALALAQGQEVDKQNDRLTGLSSKTESLNTKIDRGTAALKKIK